MLCSGGLLVVYVLILVVTVFRWAFRAKAERHASPYTRTVSPWLGLLGFLGFLGSWGSGPTVSTARVAPFIFFAFFGFFGFFYEGRLSHTFMDERFKENAARAQLQALRVSFAMEVIALVVLGQRRFGGNLDYTLIAVMITLSLSVALALFLSEYLLYRYDHDEQMEEGGE